MSDAPPEVKTFEEYGWRVDSEETCFADQSHGVQLASALIRAAHALARRCGVLAIPTRSRVAQGTAVVTQGQRRWVDAQGFRGQRDLNIGWNWVTLARSRGDERLPSVHLAAAPDPVPAMASTIQHQQQPAPVWTLEFQDAVA